MEAMVSTGQQPMGGDKADTSSDKKNFDAYQRKIALRQLASRSDVVLRTLRNKEEEVFVFLERLIFDLYELDQQGRRMTMGMACDAIPVRHTATAKKYVNFAHDEGLVSFESHPIDKRKILVVATEKLRQFVEHEVLVECKRIELLVQDFHPTEL